MNWIIKIIQGALIGAGGTGGVENAISGYPAPRRAGIPRRTLGNEHVGGVVRQFGVFRGETQSRC